MDTLKYPWHRPYLAALTEIHPEKLAIRIALADDAVFERLLQLEGSIGTEAERLELEDTLECIRLLRSQRYQFMSPSDNFSSR